MQEDSSEVGITAPGQGSKEGRETKASLGGQALPSSTPSPRSSYFEGLQISGVGGECLTSTGRSAGDWKLCQFRQIPASLLPWEGREGLRNFCC